MPQPPPPDPQLVAYALELRGQGHSLRDVAKKLAEIDCPVSYATIGNWERKAAAAGKPDAPRRPNLSQSLADRKPPAAGTTSPAFANIGDLRSVFQELLDQSVADAARTRGNNDKWSSAAQSRAVELAGHLRQIDKLAAEDKAMIKVSARDLADAYTSLIERVINPLLAREGRPPLPVEP